MFAVSVFVVSSFGAYFKGVVLSANNDISFYTRALKIVSGVETREICDVSISFTRTLSKTQPLDRF